MTKPIEDKGLSNLALKKKIRKNKRKVLFANIQHFAVFFFMLLITAYCFSVGNWLMVFSFLLLYVAMIFSV